MSINWEQVSRDIQVKKDATKTMIVKIENYVAGELQAKHGIHKIGLVLTKAEYEIEENNRFMIWVGENYTRHEFISIADMENDINSLTKTEYWYEFTLRGFSPFCQPKGHLDIKNGIGKYGIIAYNRPLTKSELDEYELKAYKAV